MASGKNGLGLPKTAPARPELLRYGDHTNSEIDDHHVALDGDLGLRADDLIPETAQSEKRGDLGSSLFGIEFYAGSALPVRQEINRHLRLALAVVDGRDGPLESLQLIRGILE